MKFFHIRFLMDLDLHILRCPEHDLTNLWKCLYVRYTNFVASLAQKLIFSPLVLTYQPQILFTTKAKSGDHFIMVAPIRQSPLPRMKDEQLYIHALSGIQTGAVAMTTLAKERSFSSNQLIVLVINYSKIISFFKQKYYLNFFFYHTRGPCPLLALLVNSLLHGLRPLQPMLAKSHLFLANIEQILIRFVSGVEIRNRQLGANGT